MERRQGRGSIDELAMVKAAAWSWYQRGSGSGRERPEREYCSFSRTRRCPRPSRYKLEAMNYDYSSAASPSRSEVRSNSHLLDAYEIERISRQLDSYKEGRNLEENNGFLGYGEPRASDVKTKTEKKQRSKRKSGFWKGHAVAVCGSRINDVVEIRRDLSAGRPPEKHVGVVCVANCRPRTVIHRHGL
ncbi:uncharacterized protein LOC127799858 [Diospyros lotus]|uniref:uncharacterized protein LOC127799858 n=1 Tax=Diospyros lotus TaxID=55363 RepID=UPI00225534E8|nr:uncharacterized protein LOC127799858 [Diospyros lotus]